MFFIKPQFTSRLWRLSRVPPGPMNLFVQILDVVFELYKDLVKDKTHSADKPRLGKMKVYQRLDDE